MEDHRFYLLIAAGVIFYISLYFGQKQLSKSADALIKVTALRDAAKTFKFAQYVGGLVLVWGGLALTVYGISVTSGSVAMSASDMALFHSATVVYIILFFIIVGIFFAAWVAYVIECLVAYFRYKKHGLPPDNTYVPTNPPTLGNPPTKAASVNIDLKIDIATMTKEQINAANKMIDKLQGK